MEEIFIDVLRTAALQAGAVARRLQGKVPLRDKGGGTPESAALTAVDLATQDVLLLALHRAFADAAVDAEEDTETVNLFRRADGRPLIVLDPIDGTLNYARGEDDYAVMGSLVREHVVAAAVVHFPQWGRMLWAIRGGGCWEQSERPAAGGEPTSGGWLSAPRRVRIVAGVSAGATGARPLVLVSPRTARNVQRALHAQGFEVRVSRCSAVDSCAPAAGRAAAALTTKPADRRRALGFLTTLEAGGVVRCAGRDWQGEDAPGGLEPPCIAAESRELAERIERVVRGTW